MLTVRDLLENFKLRVLAGEGAVDAQVHGVQVSDLLDPTPWLARGELVLTTAAQLNGDESCADYIARLAASGVAGLGIATDGEKVGPSSAIRDAAAQASLPLFAVPSDVPFIALTHLVSTRLLGEPERRLARVLALQDRLEQDSEPRPGLGPLVNALAEALGAAVLLSDGNGRPIVTSEPDQPLDRAMLRALRSEIVNHGNGSDSGVLKISLMGPTTAAGLHVSGDGRIGAAARDADRRSGVWLVAVRQGADLVDRDLEALRHAAPIVALELLRRRVSRERERQLAAETLAAVLQADLPGEEVERRLAAFGLRETVAAIVVRPAMERGLPVRRVESALSVALRRESAAGVVGSTGSLSVALIPGLPDDELFTLAERIAFGVASAFGARVELGVGRSGAAGDAAKSVEEARFALEAKSMATSDAVKPGDGVEAPASIATYRDLGSYQLLLALQGHEALQRFCDSLLGPIEAMESSYGGELLRSLQVFIECNGQWERAARQLFCHRHTLRYRIRKIEELTGRDLEAAPDRIEFYLALRARALLPWPENTPPSPRPPHPRSRPPS